MDNKLTNNKNIEYWLNEKRKYEYNLKNNIGDNKSIEMLIDKINTKLDRLINK